MTYTQSVIDAFNGSSLDTSKWTTPQGSSDITESSGTLNIHATANYNEIRSVSTHDLTTGILAVQVSQSGTATTATEFYINVADASGNSIQLDQVPSGTYAEIDSGGTGVVHTGDTVGGTGVGSGWTNGHWIGVGNFNASTKVLTWYSSADGQTWVEIAHTTVTAGINFSAGMLSIVAGCYSGTVTWAVQLDNASFWTNTTTGGGGGGGTGTTYTYLQNVYDNFDDNSFDTSRWTDESEISTSGRITESGGTLQVKALPGGETEVDTTGYFDLTKGLWGVQWSHTGTGTSTEDGTEIYFGFADNASDTSYFEIQGWPANNSWYSWRGWDSGSDGRTEGTDIGAQNMLGVAWNAGDYIAFGNHNVNSDNRMHIYKTSDLITWTEIGSVLISSGIDMTHVQMFMGAWQMSGSATWVSVFDDVSTFTRQTSSGGGTTGGGGTGGTGGGSGTFTPTNQPLLGMYETNGAFPTPGPSAWASGARTNLTATYMAWGQDIPTYIESFVNQCNANGLTPFVELEPWDSGASWNQTPLFSDITGGAWDTWLEAIGTFIASTGKACILTFAHEFNVSGQYPWSQGDTGSGPGGGSLSAANWIAGWKYVHDKINSTANGHAYWMWACSAYTGGTTISPAPWWPGASFVDMVGIDGYPNTQYGSALGTFAGQIQPTVTIIRGLGWSNPIYLSETNLQSMVNSGGESITSFVSDMFHAGCSGILSFEDAAWDLPQMTSAHWAEYNAAILANYGAPTGGGGGTGTGGGGTVTSSLVVTKLTADQVSSVSGVASSAHTFYPVAGGQVRICATWLDATDLLGKTFTCKDSNNVSYTATLAGGDSDGGCYLLIFDHVYTTAPGAITVSITCSNTAPADCLIQPYQLTGQASDQSGAAHNSVFGNVSVDNVQISLTTTEVGSQVFILGAPNNNNHPVPTAINGTITDVDWDDDNVGSHGVIGRSSAATAVPGDTLYGWTLSADSIYGYGAIASEVLADSSTTSGGSGASNFTPVGSWIEATGDTFTWAPAAEGNVLVVIPLSKDAGKPVTAISSSNASWSQLVSDQTIGSFTVVEATAYLGTATGTSSQTVTMTSTATSGDLRMRAHEFDPNGGIVHLDTFVILDSDVSGSVNAWPSITPTHGTGELLFGHEVNAGTTAIVGSTGGVVYSIDANDNGSAYDDNVSTAQVVGWGDTSDRFALVLLLYAITSGGSGGSGGAYVKTEIDNFNDDSIDDTIWSLHDISSGSTTITPTLVDNFNGVNAPDTGIWQSIDDPIDWTDIFTASTVNENVNTAMTPVGSWITGTAKTISWTPTAVGNILVIISVSSDTTKPVTGATATTGVTMTTEVSAQNLGTTTARAFTGLIGTATSTGAKTITLTSTNTTGNFRNFAHEFNPNGKTVSFDAFHTQNGESVGSSNSYTAAAPTGIDELLFGVDFTLSGTASAGSTSGINYGVDASGNLGFYGADISASKTVGFGETTTRHVLVFYLNAYASTPVTTPINVLRMNLTEAYPWIEEVVHHDFSDGTIAGVQLTLHGTLTASCETYWGLVDTSGNDMFYESNPQGSGYAVWGSDSSADSYPIGGAPGTSVGATNTPVVVQSSWTNGTWIGVGFTDSTHFGVYTSTDGTTWVLKDSIEYVGTIDQTQCLFYITIGNWAGDTNGDIAYVTMDNYTLFVPVTTPDTTGTLQETGERLVFHCTSNYPGISLIASTYDITAGILAFQWFPNVGSIVGGEVFEIQLYDTAGHGGVFAAIAGDTWYSDHDTVTVGSKTGDDTAFYTEWTPGDWLGLTYSASTLHIVHSTDGQTWNTVGTIPVTSTYDATSVNLTLYAGQTEDTSTWEPTIDNMAYWVFDPDATPPGAQAIKVRVGAAWINAVPVVRIGGAWVAAVARVRVGAAWVTPS